jgi:hypothetical protein
VSGVRGVSDPQMETETLCEAHRGSGPLAVRREGERIMPDAHAEECCMITLEDAAATRLFTVLGEWRG